jgi:hypothetical protein
MAKVYVFSDIFMHHKIKVAYFTPQFLSNYPFVCDQERTSVIKYTANL